MAISTRSLLGILGPGRLWALTQTPGVRPWLQIVYEGRLRAAHGRLQLAKTGLEQVDRTRGALAAQLKARVDALDSRITAALGQEHSGGAYDPSTVGGPPPGPAPIHRPGPPLGPPRPLGAGVAPAVPGVPAPAPGGPAPAPPVAPLPPPAAGAPAPPPPVAGAPGDGAIPQPIALPSPTVTNPAPGSPASVAAGTTQYTIQGTFAAAGPQGTAIQVFRTDQWGQPLPGPIVAGSAELLPGDAAFAVIVYLDPSGPNNFVLNAQDFATGAVSAPTPVVTILPPPTAPVISDLEGTRERGTTHFVVTGISQPNTTVQAFRAANGVKAARAEVLASDTLFGGQTNFTLRFSLEDLPRQLAFTAATPSGNESTPTIVPLFTPREREREEREERESRSARPRRKDRR